VGGSKQSPPLPLARVLGSPSAGLASCAQVVVSLRAVVGGSCARPLLRARSVARGLQLAHVEPTHVTHRHVGLEQLMAPRTRPELLLLTAEEIHTGGIPTAPLAIPARSARPPSLPASPAPVTPSRPVGSDRPSPTFRLGDPRPLVRPTLRRRSARRRVARGPGRLGSSRGANGSAASCEQVDAGGGHLANGHVN